MKDASFLHVDDPVGTGCVVDLKECDDDDNDDDEREEREGNSERPR